MKVEWARDGAPLVAGLLVAAVVGSVLMGGRIGELQLQQVREGCRTSELVALLIERDPSLKPHLQHLAGDLTPQQIREAPLCKN